jgi:hypothetical protein
MTKKQKILYISWYDHYSLGEEWYEKKVKTPSRVIESVGFLMDEDDQYYYISSLRDTQTKCYSSGIAILKNCVKELKHLA